MTKIILNWHEEVNGYYAIADSTYVRKYEIRASYDNGFIAEMSTLAKGPDYTLGWCPTLNIAKSRCQEVENFWEN